MMITREREIEILRATIEIADKHHDRPPREFFDVRFYATDIGVKIVNSLRAQPTLVPYYCGRDDTLDFAKHLIDGDLDQAILDIFNESEWW